MILIKSIIVAVVILFSAAFALDELTSASDTVQATLSIIAAALAFILTVYGSKARKSALTITSSALGGIGDVRQAVESNIDSKQADLFYVAEQEYEGGEIDKGLWSQAIVKAKGDERLRKVEYMKLRVKQLKLKKHF